MSNARNHNWSLSRSRQQAAYVSSAEYTRGVFANLVAQRCGLLTNPETISLLWWLQRVSWRDGSLDQFARDFLRDHQHLIGTPSMHRFGRGDGQVYSAHQVKAIRPELRLEYEDPCDLFPLQCDPRTRYGEPSYPVSAFLECCDIREDKFARELEALMLNPKLVPEAGLWNMPGLLPALTECREAEIARAASGIVNTEVTKQVSDMLDFALQERAFVLIEGREGIGKTEAAENWCVRHPGRAVYVKLESGGDEATFYRSLARQIGTATSCVANEIRARLEDALQPGRLMLVVDESHFLWPERRSKRTPRRVDWLRTALIDRNVPVAIIATPQYFETQCTRFREAGWNANQIQRRLTETLSLPEQLDVKDVLAVARAVFRDVDDATLKRIGAFALGSVGYLTSIKHVRQLAAFEASKKPGLSTQAAVLRVLERKGIPVSNTGDSRRAREAVKVASSESKGRMNAQPAPAALRPPNRVDRRGSINPENLDAEQDARATPGASLRERRGTLPATLGSYG